MISAIVLTKNEEKNIEACLESIAWCDERIVIDDHSDDKTVEIAKRKGAKVFSRFLQQDFADQRNYGLEKANGDWVLFVDADERISSALWYEIMQHTSESFEDYSGFYIKRQDTMWGKILRYGETGNIMLLRLAKKGVGKWEGKVHEKWKVSGKTIVLINALDHFPHTTVAEFLKEINFYTDLRAEELFQKKMQSNSLSIIVYPKAKFILNYFFRRGFMDGLPGLVFAVLMSFHSFLVRGKLWLMWQKSK
ncbi:MAG TPA: glycosyltransferase family 2 protein [Candidatus Sulfotelmatobacter sp.]|jgi:glycosyltransferase involved in cell wall biosynthesis|nr:glycosyltransferase family 2 protein [Candidatus Sulfotelmatobacter sp.]